MKCKRCNIDNEGSPLGLCGFCEADKRNKNRNKTVSDFKEQNVQITFNGFIVDLFTTETAILV